MSVTHTIPPVDFFLKERFSLTLKIYFIIVWGRKNVTEAQDPIQKSIITHFKRAIMPPKYFVMQNLRYLIQLDIKIFCSLAIIIIYNYNYCDGIKPVFDRKVGNKCKGLKGDSCDSQNLWDSVPEKCLHTTYVDWKHEESDCLSQTISR